MNLESVLIRVRSVEVLERFLVRLGFTDGSWREIDLEPRLRGEVFEPLRDPEYFRKVMVEDGTIRWPNGADFDPDVLYYGGPPPWAKGVKPNGRGKRRSASRK